ncbi:pyridoxamine 5'-phosphate oxidase-domain-containing protein [Xylariomycetidae sp. FL0641]|nr:pyridoxamine 5'-phosphate oxidase-domain-containing protein [Xylariomycetidae sp. FL0641]
MKLLQNLPLLLFAARPGVAEPAAEPQYILSNPPASDSDYRIPTAYESAVMGRRILGLTPLGTVATVFPGASDRLAAEENRPDGLGGVPVGLMEYVADCEDTGNPTFLAIQIATTFKNIRAGSNVSLAQQWTPPYPPKKRIKSLSFLDRLLGCGNSADDDEPKDTVPYSAANLPRYSLFGYTEKIESMSSKDLAECFVKKHPDAKYWLPGNQIHESEFVRMVVTHIYWVGGFGDRAYIGWIPVEDWRNVTKKESEDLRLPGEKKGWKEWSAWNIDDL